MTQSYSEKSRYTSTNVLLPKTMRELHLFAGAGGGILGGILLGHHPVCAVEIEPYCRRVLLQRQRDGVLPRFPIWDDVRTFDGRPWRGRVDALCGGFPCQDISAIGGGEGITGERSGLWAEMRRIVGEVEPRFVLVENSPVLASRGLGVVLGDLAAMGYGVRWGVFSACMLGAPHPRERLFALADSEGEQSGQPSERQGREGAGGGNCDCGGDEKAGRIGFRQWGDEPAVGRVADGVGNRMDRLAALGNGQVPQVAALAWRVLSNRIAK